MTAGSAAAYWAARKQVAWADRSQRVRLEVTGPDRVRFLQNLTTNDVKRLQPGKGCEAFITSLQGKTLGWVSLHALPDCILLRSDPAALEPLLPHFEKYGAFDDVRCTDVGPTQFELHVCGPALAELCARLGLAAPAPAELAHAAFAVAGNDLIGIWESPTAAPGLTLIGPLGDQSGVVDALGAAGAGLGLVQIDPETFEVLRIEAGTPVFGRDISVENLPQEVGRDARAICFVKGCYLGQETVARIDALGHVNKLLRGLLMRGDNAPVPAPGSVLELEQRKVGTVTSAAFSPSWGRPVLLGYVRAGHDAPGTVLSVTCEGAAHSAEVTPLPILIDAPSR